MNCKFIRNSFSTNIFCLLRFIYIYIYINWYEPQEWIINAKKFTTSFVVHVKPKVVIDKLSTFVAKMQAVCMYAVELYILSTVIGSSQIAWLTKFVVNSQTTPIFNLRRSIGVLSVVSVAVFFCVFCWPCRIVGSSIVLWGLCWLRLKKGRRVTTLLFFKVILIINWITITYPSQYRHDFERQHLEIEVIEFESPHHNVIIHATNIVTMLFSMT